MLLIGIGNSYRRDDGAGPAVADAVARRLGGDVRIVILPGEGTELMQAWSMAVPGEDVVVVDAMRSGAAPGQIRRFDLSRDFLPTDAFPCSSHRFGLAEAVEMARILDQLPPRLTVWGIEGADFSQGEGLSPEVAVAVETLTNDIALIKNKDT